MLLNSLKEGQATPDAINLWKELVLEANTQLNIFAVPEEIFGEYKELIKITAYDCLKKAYGTDPRKEYKRFVINEEN